MHPCEGLSAEGSPVSWAVRFMPAAPAERRGVESSIALSELENSLISCCSHSGSALWQSGGHHTRHTCGVWGHAVPTWAGSSVLGAAPAHSMPRLSSHLPLNQIYEFRNQGTFCPFKNRFSFFFFLIQIFFGDCGAFHQLFLVAEGQCAQDRFHLTLPKGELWLWLANKMFRLLLPCLPTPASFT